MSFIADGIVYATFYETFIFSADQFQAFASWSTLGEQQK